MVIKSISENVIRRLPKYMRILEELENKCQQKTSSAELGKLLGFTPSQVRQDFNSFGSFGQQGYGYDVAQLRIDIGEILGCGRGYKAVLIGVGQVGLSLMESFDFSVCGAELVAAFEVDPEKIGTEHRGVKVYDVAELSAFLEDHAIDFGVLAVPKAQAQACADQLFANGITAIWNFTNTDVTEPGSKIISENVHFSDSLCVLSYFIKAKQKNA